MTWIERLLIFVVAASPLYLIRFSVGPIPFTVFEVLIFIFVGATVARAMMSPVARLAYQEKLRAIPMGFRVASLIFIIAGVVSVVVSPHTMSALGIFRAYIIEAMALGCAVYLNLSSYRILRVLGWTLAGVASVVAVYAIVQKFTGWGIPNPYWQAVATRRVTSVFGYPNAVGLYLELIIPFLVALIFLAKSWRERVVAGLIIGMSCLAILWAESSGTVAALGGTVAFALVAYRRTRVTALVVGVVCGLVIVCSPLRGPFMDEFLLQGYSGQIRTSMWRETVQMLRPRWVTGAGLAGYQTHVAPYHILKRVEIYLYPHNLVLTLWSELGVIGLGAFVWVCGIVWMSALRVMRFASAYEFRVWAGVVMATLVIIALHGLVDTPYFKNDFSALFWVIVAIAMHVRYTEHSS